MSWESVGSVDTGEGPEDAEWIEFCQKLAIQYIKLVCGEPPLGAKLGIMAHEHDLGIYTSIGVWSDYSMPYDYISACENALEVFNSAVSWYELKELYEKQFNDEGDVDEDGEADEDSE